MRAQRMAWYEHDRSDQSLFRTPIHECFTYGSVALSRIIDCMSTVCPWCSQIGVRNSSAFSILAASLFPHFLLTPAHVRTHWLHTPIWISYASLALVCRVSSTWYSSPFVWLDVADAWVNMHWNCCCFCCKSHVYRIRMCCCITLTSKTLRKLRLCELLLGFHWNPS